jgi:DNA-binding CsgD family transcriptional regulator
VETEHKPAGDLTARQRDVLALLTRGHTNPEIAERLGISVQGVKWHVTALLDRFGAANRDELIARIEAGQRPLPRVRRAAVGIATFAAAHLAAGVAAGVVILIGVAAVAAALVGVRPWHPDGGESGPRLASLPRLNQIASARFERPQGGTAPLANLDPANPTDAATLRRVLGWLGDARVVSGGDRDNGDHRTEPVLFMRLDATHVLEVVPAVDCVTVSDPQPDGSNYRCSPAGGDAVSVADMANGFAAGETRRVVSRPLASWLAGGWQRDLRTRDTTAHPPLPDRTAVVSLQMSTYPPGSERAPLEATNVADAAVIDRVWGWLAASVVVPDAVSDASLSLGHLTGMGFALADGVQLRVRPAADGSVSYAADGSVSGSVLTAMREYVDVTYPDRREARVWSPALAAWLLGGFIADTRPDPYPVR